VLDGNSALLGFVPDLLEDKIYTTGSPRQVVLHAATVLQKMESLQQIQLVARPTGQQQANVVEFWLHTLPPVDATVVAIKST